MWKLWRVYRTRSSLWGATCARRSAGSVWVDKLESRADDIFAELYRDMFDWDTDYKTFHQLKSIIERLESIADRCSQNAELVRHLALEYIEND